MPDSKDAIGPLLNPALAIEHEQIEKLIAGVDSEDNKIDAALCFYTLEAAEAAFMFDMIMGSHLSWPLIEALPAPDAPPRKERGAR